MTETETKNDIKPVENEGHFFEMVRTALLAIVIALTVRTFAYEPFSIPSGSMIPTFLVGDYLFVSKYSYGYSQYSFPGNWVNFNGRMKYNEPKRGDVTVFKLPQNTNIDYIKRIVGLPGDTVQVIDGILYINGDPVRRELVGTYVESESFGQEVIYNQFKETLPGGKEHMIIERSDVEIMDNTPLYTVPPKSFFMMGDNRDGSQDSRYMDKVGFVPADNLVGRADFLFFSVDHGAHAWEFWRWPWTIRFKRLFTRIL